MSHADYLRGMSDQQVLNDMSSAAEIGAEVASRWFSGGSSSSSSRPAPRPPSVDDLAEIEKMRMHIIPRLELENKKLKEEKYELENRIQQLEARLSGLEALKEALRKEAGQCPHHAAHPLGSNRKAQLRVVDYAYVKKAKEILLSRSMWSKNVIRRGKEREKERVEAEGGFYMEGFHGDGYGY